MLLSGYIIASTNKTQQVIKIPVIVFELDTTTFKTNEPLNIDSTQFAKIESFINDSTDLKKELERLKSDLSSLKVLIETNKKNTTTYKILFYVLGLLNVAILVFLLLDKKKRRDEILYTLTGRKRNKEASRLSEWEKGIVEMAVEKTKQIQLSAPVGVRSNNIELMRTIEDLQKRIAILEDDSRAKLAEDSVNIEKQPEIEEVPITKTLYADAIINGILNKVTEQPNDDTVYELILKTQTDNAATLTIFRDAYRRVLKNTDFIDGCEKQRINNIPNDLHVEKGEVLKQDTGKWKVTKRANVKFV